VTFIRELRTVPIASNFITEPQHATDEAMRKYESHCLARRLGVFEGFPALPFDGERESNVGEIDMREIMDGCDSIIAFEEQHIPLHLYPYTCIIPTPVFLNTILLRLESDWYRSVDQLLYDALTMYTNTCLYYRCNVDRMQEAKVLTKLIHSVVDQIMADLSCPAVYGREFR